MRFRNRKHQFYLGRFRHYVLENPFICSAEGDGDGEGGGGGKDNNKKLDGNQNIDADAIRSELNTALKAITTEIKAIKSQSSPADLTPITAAIAELKSELAVVKESGQQKQQDGDKKDDKAVDPETKAQVAAMEKQLKILQTELQAAKAQAQEESTKRTESEARQRGLERDRMIITAYRAAGGRDDIDDKTILRQFREEFTYSDNETWVTEDGADISGFIKKNLPAFMKKPKSSNGGGGGHSPSGDDTPTLSQLETQAIEAGVKAKKAGLGTRESALYDRAKKAFVDAGGNISKITDAVTQA